MFPGTPRNGLQSPLNPSGSTARNRAPDITSAGRMASEVPSAASEFSHWATIAAAVPVAAVAVIAGVVSFSHIEGLALRTHQSITDARLLPFAVDGLIVAGVVVVLAGYALGWCSVVLGVAATVYANVESGLPYGHLAAVVAAWPAIAFSVASFVLERWLKSQVSRGGQGGTEAATDSDKERVTRFITEGDPAVPDQCGHVLAGEPSEVVVNAYLHGRDCLGNAPSQRSLAATYGLHRTKVAALVGPLNGHGG